MSPFWTTRRLGRWQNGRSKSCFSYIRIAWKSSRLFQTLLKGFTSRVLSLEASNIDTSLDGCFSRKANFLWNLSISCHTTHCKAKQSNSDLLEPTLHVSLGCGSFGNGRVASAKVCRRFAKKQRFGVSVFILLGFLQTSYQYLVCQNDALTSDWSELHVFKWGRQVENLEWTNKPVKYTEKRFVCSNKTGPFQTVLLNLRLAHAIWTMTR